MRPSWKHRALTKRFGGLVAVDDVDLIVNRNTIHSLIGPKRGRQDDLVQPALWSGGVGLRDRHIQGAGDHRPAVSQDYPAGYRALVPTHPGIFRLDYVRERARGRPNEASAPVESNSGTEAGGSRLRDGPSGSRDRRFVGARRCEGRYPFAWGATRPGRGNSTCHRAQPAASRRAPRAACPWAKWPQ